ncbi:MAG: ParA family protein [SAR202 cluster bacterium]|nr:ParA family protein [SAR202 cluster bacterium]
MIGTVSQKGGVGKSTIARLIAREFAAQKWSVKIADLDISQATSFRWRSRRLEIGIKPDVPVEQYGRVEQALAIAPQYDLLVIDGAPHATLATQEIAKVSDIVIIPTGLAVDDLEPTVLLAHDLAKHTDPSRIAFALCRVGDSLPEIEEVRRYLTRTTYTVLDGALPDMTGYRRAFDEGRVASETRYPGLNKRAQELAQSIATRIATLVNERAA